MDIIALTEISYSGCDGELAEQNVAIVARMLFCDSIGIQN